MTLQRIIALPFRPLMWLIAVPWQEAAAAALMAIKTVLNEFVAYLRFSTLPPGTFDPCPRLTLTSGTLATCTSGAPARMLA